MSIKASLALTALILGAALTTPAFAQSGIITFKGRIVAPVCSGTVASAQGRANPSAHESPAFSMDNSGCENSIDMPASTRMRSDVPPTQGLVRTHAGHDSAEPVLTITYH